MPYSYTEGRYIHDFKPLPSFTVERNLLTFATSRSGKGGTQIIPFLRRANNCNALVIDPKGEALEQSIKHRRAHGQNVHALDPFKTARITNRAKINLLDAIDPNSPNAFRQINAIADGLVMRHDPKGGHWDGGGLEVLAGVIAHVLTAPEFEGHRSLVTVRRLLTATGDSFHNMIEAMAENFACGALPATGASKILNTGNEAGHFLSVATTNTKWLDDPQIAECLASSTFRLDDLKNTPMDVFLILPMDALGDYGRFLRLFTRMALFHMQQKLPNGELKGREAYFILDEFFSLGHIAEIENSMGGMPGFNLHLWPFLQDYNQLAKLYGAQGAGTFFANSDASYFYGVNDADTAGLVSRAAGLVAEHELKVKAPPKPSITIPQQAGGMVRLLGWETPEQRAYRMAHEPPEANSFWPEYSQQEHSNARARFEHERANREAVYTDKMNQYAHARSCIGHPRINPEQVAQITKRSPTRKIAEKALVIREGECFLEPLTAYWEQQESLPQPRQKKPIAITPPKPKNHFEQRYEGWIEALKKDGYTMEENGDWVKKGALTYTDKTIRGIALKYAIEMQKEEESAARASRGFFGKLRQHLNS